MKLISSREITRNRIFTVTWDHAVDPDGFEIERAIVQHRGSAVMMAVDEKKRILLVRQYRLPVRQYLWELPAGTVDPGETPLRTARRELTEETGYRARKWTKLAEFYPSAGFLSEKMTIYLATGLTAGEAQPMDDERIETRWFTEKEVDAMIRSGKIKDAKTNIGYLRWKRYGASIPRRGGK
jgi:ADP-ribose pyrophosphatase